MVVLCLSSVTKYFLFVSADHEAQRKPLTTESSTTPGRLSDAILGIGLIELGDKSALS